MLRCIAWRYVEYMLLTKEERQCAFLIGLNIAEMKFYLQMNCIWNDNPLSIYNSKIKTKRPI